MLAIGIGANVAAFGFFNLFVLRPLPVRDPDTLLRFERRSPRWYATDLPYPAMAFYRAHATTLSAVLALHSTQTGHRGRRGADQRAFRDVELLRRARGRAALGRMLDPAVDEAPDADPVVVLSHGFWQRHFGANPLGGRYDCPISTARQPPWSAWPPRVSVASPSEPRRLGCPLRLHPYFVDRQQAADRFLHPQRRREHVGSSAAGLTAAVAEDEAARTCRANCAPSIPTPSGRASSCPASPVGYAQIGGGSQRGSGAPGVTRGTTRCSRWSGRWCLLILAVACGNLGGLLLARGVARERELADPGGCGRGPARGWSASCSRRACCWPAGAAAGSRWPMLPARRHARERGAALARSHARLAGAPVRRRRGLHGRDLSSGCTGMAGRPPSPSCHASCGRR